MDETMTDNERREYEAVRAVTASEFEEDPYGATLRIGMYRRYGVASYKAAETFCRSRVPARGPANIAEIVTEAFLQIVGVAVRYNGLTISMLAPARHYNILHTLSKMNEDAALEAEQGFITGDGHFVNREEAKRIVAVTKQPTIANHNPRELFSEDLW